MPEFWEWLVHLGTQGRVKLPLEVHEEIEYGQDDLAKWSRNNEVKQALLLNEDVDVALVARITDEGYAPDLTDDEVEKIGRDPFLIAYAFADLGERCVVTTEVSKRAKERANRKVPDICDDLRVPWCDTFRFVRDMNFSTNWKSA